MKALTFLPLVFAVGFSPLVAQNESAPAAEPAPAAPAAELLPNQKAFLNLPEEKRKEFVKHLSEASRLFQQKRVFETLDELDKANAIFTDSPEILNLRGSCYVEMRAFDKALAAFEAARKLAPANSSIEFNIAEVFFVTKEYKKSHDLFEEILKKIPQQNIALTRIIEYKILLCKKKLGRKDEALTLAEKYGYQDDSPFYYYAQASLAYEDGDLLKAEQWLAMAARIFRDPNILAPWQDTLVEFGYIKSFYGEDVEDPAGK